MTIAYQPALFLALAVVASPLLTGVIARTKALVGGRRGPPLLQAYFDLAKLLRRGAVYSTTTTWVFRIAPSAVLAGTVLALLVVPMAAGEAVLGFSADFLLLTGALALGRFAMIAAAMDTGSAFEGMGASREAMISAIAEPALLLVLVTLAVVSGGESMAAMLGAGLSGPWLTGAGPALVLAATSLFLLLLAENARIPVDDPNTHLELTMVHEVMILDHSGPDLAFLTYAAALKLWLFGALLVGVTLPVRSGALWVDTLVFLGGVVGVAVAVGVVESSMARLRMAQVPQLLTVAAALGAMSVAIAFGVS